MTSKDNNNIRSSTDFSEGNVIKAMAKAMGLDQPNSLSEVPATVENIYKILSDVLDSLGLLVSYGKEDAKDRRKSAVSKIQYDVNAAFNKVKDKELDRLQNAINNLTAQLANTNGQVAKNNIQNRIKKLQDQLNNFIPDIKSVTIEAIQGIMKNLGRFIMFSGSIYNPSKEQRIKEQIKANKASAERLKSQQSIPVEKSPFLQKYHETQKQIDANVAYINSLKSANPKKESLGSNAPKILPSENVTFVGGSKGIYKQSKSTALAVVKGSSVVPVSNPSTALTFLGSDTPMQTGPLNYNPKDRGVLVDSPIARRWTRTFIRHLVNALKNLPIFNMTKKVFADAITLGLLAHASKQGTPKWLKKLELAFVALKGPESAIQLGSNITGGLIEGATQSALNSLMAILLAKRFGINISGSLKAGRLTYVNPARSPLRGKPGGPIKSVNGNVIHADFNKNLKHSAKGVSLVDDPITIGGKSLLRTGLKSAGGIAKGIGAGVALTALDIFGDPFVEKSVINGKSPSWIKKAQLAQWHASKGAAGMAFAGAGVGSLLPGVGTGIGAGIGAIIGGIYGLIKGLTTDVEAIRDNQLINTKGDIPSIPNTVYINNGANEINPLSGGHKITSSFGKRKAPLPGASSNHKGVDLDYKFGESVPAFRSGKVTRVGQWGSGGLTVTIDTGAYTERYMHLSEASVQEGDEIKAGQEIGKAGSSNGGKIKGMAPHLHYETQKNTGFREHVDPMSTFAKDDGTGDALAYINANGFNTTRNALNGVVS